MKKTIHIFDPLLSEIESELKHLQMDISIQQDKFYENPEYKEYSGNRNDKGYDKWKKSVFDKFLNTCCVCLSKEKVVAHHLYSYKYYPELRTDENNGVCLCEICHTNFNDIYSNVNTLAQFIEFREKYKGKPSKRLSSEERHKPKKLTKEGLKKLNNYRERISNPLQKKPVTENKELKNIVAKLEDLKQRLYSEYLGLIKKYNYEKGIPFEFRGKMTTTLSAQSKLQKEVMRLNTLISCNKLKDKKIMATKFFMTEEEFCKIIQDPNEYLRFSDAEITHLNRIYSQDYRKESKAELEELNRGLRS